MNNTLRFNPNLQRLDHKAGASAILTARHLKNITAVFRAVEFLLLLAVISRCYLMLPVAFRLSNDYFRQISVDSVSPRFVFVVGNAIVIILFVKSGGRISRPSASAVALPETPTTYILSVYSSPAKKLARGNPPEEAAAVVKINCYRRSKSEKMQVKPAAERKSGGAALRRTKTERHVEQTGRRQYPEDGMSNEEFRRKIENFIARQQRTLREEEESDESGALAVAR